MVAVGGAAQGLQVRGRDAAGMKKTWTIAALGLPDPAVREGIDRLRSALRHTGFKLPQRRVVVNLAPADVRKHGASLDLPMPEPDEEDPEDDASDPVPVLLH